MSRAASIASADAGAGAGAGAEIRRQVSVERSTVEETANANIDFVHSKHSVIFISGYYLFLYLFDSKNYGFSQRCVKDLICLLCP